MPPLPEATRDTLRGPQGARWHRCALQVNPHRYVKHEQGGRLDRWESAGDYADTLVDALVRADVSVIGITDHDCFDDSAILLQQRATDKGITVFPGFEFKAVDGAEFLCLFEPGTPPDDVRGMCARARNGDEPVSGKELLRMVWDGRGVVIAAHAEDQDGLLHGPGNHHRVELWRDPRLLGVSVHPQTLQGETRRDGYSERIGWVNRVLENNDAEYRRGPYRDIDGGTAEDGYAIAVLYAGDVSSPKHLLGTRLKSRTTWLQLGERNISGLRSALLEHGLRVHRGSTAPTPPGHRVEAIAWTGGFLDGQGMHLGADLNALIGGRGTGKSTVINSLAFVTGQEGEDGLLFVQDVLRSGSELWAVIDKQGRRYLAHRTVPARGDIPGAPSLFKLEEEDRIVPSSLQLSELAPELFGQGEIAAYADDSRRITALLQRFRRDPDEQSPRHRQLQDLASRLQDNRQKILKWTERLDRYERQASRLPELKEKLSHYADLGLEEDTRTDEKLLLGEVLEDIEALEQVAESIRQVELREQLLSDKRLEELKQGELLKQLRPALAQLATGRDQAQQVLKAASEGARRILETTRQQWEDAGWAVQQRITRTLGDDADGISARAEFKRLRKKVGDAQKAVRDQDQARSQLDTLRARRRELVQGRDRYLDEVQSWAKMAPRDRPGLPPEDELGLLAQELMQLQRAADVVRDGTRLGRHSWLRVRVEAKLPRAQLIARLNELPGIGETTAEELLDSIERLSDLTEALDQQRSADRHQALRDLGLGNAKAHALLGALPRLRLDLDELEPEIHTTIELDTSWPEDAAPPNDHQPTYQDLDRLSVGQKATAILMMLLLQPEDQPPLVIDQPEDDLDNRYVTGHLVPALRRARGQRQLIVVTHNANIPVLGDATQVVPMATDSAQGGVRGVIDDDKVGSVDATTTRSQVEQLLEGGRAAFRRRAQRYGLDEAARAVARPDTPEAA